MRYDKGHKDATRQRILTVAAQRFRKDGISGVGIAGLMTDVGLTHGGFYGHFPSKEDLVRASLTSALTNSRDYLTRITTEEGGGLERLVRSYLQVAHRDQPERGCAIAALTAEVARHSAETREEFSGHIERLVDLVAGLLPHRTDPAAGRATATAIVGLLVGTLQLARTVTDPERSAEILQSGIDAALALGHPGQA